MLETRRWSQPVELRESEHGQTLVGYGAVFGKLSQNLGGFVEVIQPRTFAQTITQRDILALVSHDVDRLLGRTSSGTLRLSEDEIGLRYELDLPDTTEGRDLAALVARGDIKGSSVGWFTASVQDSWGRTEQGYAMRTIREVSLRDVGPTPMPAYLDTEEVGALALRSLADARQLDPEDVSAAAREDRLAELIEPTAADDNEGRATPTPVIRRLARR
jgi:HK97 family phage prohead protease